MSNLRDMKIDFNSFFKWVDELPPQTLLCLVVIGLGYMLKRAEWIPNRRIPLILMLIGGPLYLVLAYGCGRFILQGMLLSVVSWGLHKTFLKPLEERFPFLKTILCGSKGSDDSNPVLFDKSKVQPKTNETNENAS